MSAVAVLLIARRLCRHRAAAVAARLARSGDRPAGRARHRGAVRAVAPG